VEVGSAREWEAAFAAGGCSLVITDYRLLWSDGITVLRAVKARCPACPVLMFTNTGSEEVAVEAMKSGLDDYLIKSPHHFSRLTIAARTVLERAASARQPSFLREVLFSVSQGRLRLCDSPAELPARLAPAAGPMALRCETLSELRRQMQAVAAAQGISPARRNDLVSAAHEAAMNAVVHGGGGTATVGIDAAGTVQVWVEDQGAGIGRDDPPPATQEPGYTTAASSLGNGWSIIVNSVDRVFLLTGVSGTTVVLEQERYPAAPVWLDEERD
jgi:CheY-like chemotaxis protein